MQPTEREQRACLHFPHEDETHKGVRASLAKEEVGTVFLLVMFNALVIVLTQ